MSVPASGEALLAKVLSPLIDFKEVSREVTTLNFKFFSQLYLCKLLQQLVISVKMGILRAAQLKDLSTTFEQVVYHLVLL